MVLNLVHPPYLSPLCLVLGCLPAPAFCLTPPIRIIVSFLLQFYLPSAPTIVIPLIRFCNVPLSYLWLPSCVAINPFL